MSNLMHVSSNPHVRDKITTSKIMLYVILGLCPAAGYGIWHFGIRALWIIAISVITCVVSEWLFCTVTGQKSTVKDLSAVVTGLLLALNLPVSVPWWIPLIGGAFAIVIVKMLFGGIGQNFMNPALGARCFLLISFPKLMTDFSYDGFTGPTPLAQLKSGMETDLQPMIYGNIAGTIGETSMLMIVIGACFLILMGVIDLYVPASYIVTFSLCVLLFSGKGPDAYYISQHLAGGGLMLGAFFMATDYATRPITKKGQVMFGIFIGVLTAIFRIYGPSAEGVSYAIIIGNLVVPLIDKISRPKYFGKGGGKS